MDEAREHVEDLFRRESARLVAALVRALGPANLALAEDVVHDALVTAMHAWRHEVPRDPAAWILQVARRRAIDVLRRDRRLDDEVPEASVDGALSAEADAENQLSMMFAICDDALSPETHVSLILRLLCGFSTAEIARAFLVDAGTIDRRLHRGRARLQALGALADVRDAVAVRARQPSIEHALYLLFNEGYDAGGALCADALRLAELLLGASAVEPSTVHALAALFCFSAARLPARVDGDGALLLLEEQDRRRWDGALVERGVAHLGGAAAGDHWTRWHLEAAIAFEHVRAPSLAETRWTRIVEYYDALLAHAPGPVIAMNRALAVCEARGVEEGRAALDALANDARLLRYSLFWAARADLERRAGRPDDARALWERALSLARTDAERGAYQRRLRE
jgi:RNA polymerase sigma factor (sigma-70 family)